MRFNELGGTELPEALDVDVDDTVARPELSQSDGVSGTDNEVTLAGELGDTDFGADDSASDELAISGQPGAPDLEQLTFEGLRGAAEQQRADRAETTDVEPPAHLPRIEHDEETGHVRASIRDEQGTHGQINARLTQRGDGQELVIDQLNVADVHVQSDVPGWLLSNVADAAAAQGVESVDSTVGSVRALDIRKEVFGEGNLTFHDPEAKGGDTTLPFGTQVARAYLEPGDRTPLHVRALLDTSPDRQALADRYDQAAIAAQIKPPAEEVAEAAADETRPQEAADATDTASDAQAPAEDATPTETAATTVDDPEVATTDNEVSPDGRIADEASFNAFHREHSTFVRAVLVNQFGLSHADAEDVTQTAFMRAWNNRERFDGRNARAWVTRIATNEAINIHRKVGRGPKQVTDGEQLDTIFRTIESDGPQPDEAVASQDEASRMMAVMQDAVREGKMPENWAKILYLKHGMGLMDREVAETLGIPPGSAATGAMRGMARLRELMAISD